MLKNVCQIGFLSLILTISSESYAQKQLSGSLKESSAHANAVERTQTSLIQPQLLKNTKNNTSGLNTFFIHPTSLICAIPRSGLPLFFHMTYERNFQSPKSFVLSPMLFLLGVKNDSFSINIKAVGLAAGMREYFFSKYNDQGVYLQGLVSINGFDVDTKSIQKNTKKTDFIINPSIVGYIGYKKQWDRVSLLFDIGSGYQLITTKIENPNKNTFISATEKSLAFDCNLALGMSF